jgi:hypothetical protein
MVPRRTVIVLELTPQVPLNDLLGTAGLAHSRFCYQQKTLRASDKHSALKVKIREVFNVINADTDTGESRPNCGGKASSSITRRFRS